MMAQNLITYKTLTEILVIFTREEMLVDNTFMLMFCKPSYDRIVCDFRNVLARLTANEIALDKVTNGDAEKDGVMALIIFVNSLSKETQTCRGDSKNNP